MGRIVRNDDMRRKEFNQELFDKLVNKELEPYGLTVEDINHEDDNFIGLRWYERYTMTEDEEKVFTEWAINEIKNTVKPCSKEQATTYFYNFWLGWGLRVAPVAAQRKFKLKKIEDGSL